MTNQSTSSNGSGSHAPPHAKPSKKQALLLQHQQQLAQQRQTHEPWLFQSINVFHNPWGASLPSLSLGASSSAPQLAIPPPTSSISLALASPAPFYLDVESLRTLLPASTRRNRPRSSEDSYRHDAYGSPKARIVGRNQRHPPARLEALSPSARERNDTEATAQPLRHARRRKHRARSARPTSVRRKFALRIDAARARQAADARSGHDGHTTSHHHHHAGKQAPTQIGLVSLQDNDDDAELAARAATPPPPLEDLDDERRQKEAIASQLGLSLDEYEALDAAFGGDDGGADDDGSMTDGYHEIFANYDVDGSGAISPDELCGLLKAAGEDMDDTELAKVIEQADTDGDGEINFDEFMGLMRARKRLLLVAKTMGVTGTGPSVASSSSVNSTTLGHSKKGSIRGRTDATASVASPLPPLKLAVAQSKKHLAPSPFSRNFSRPTPACLRPGAQVDVTQLRRELALAEFGIQELNAKVRDGVHWVQRHCPVNSLKAQIYCHRWGMEKVQQLLLRLQSQSLSRAYQKWKSFLMYERNKLKANLFLKCKGSQKMAELLARRTRKTLRRCLAKWKNECAIDARNEIHAAAVELQRAWRGKLARLWRFHGRRRVAATAIQSLVRGHLGRRHVRRLRRARLEHECASVLQRCYRGYNGKRLARALFRAQQDALAARRIQRAFRNHQRRALLRAIQRTKLEHDRAVQLQCCMRSFLARNERRRRALQRRRERSSVVIQRQTRGLLARRACQARKRRIDAATTIQTRYRAFRSRWQCLRMRRERADRARRQRERAAATAIQTQWRSAHARRQYVSRKLQRREAQTLLAFRRLTGALRIQCVFRGYRARRRAQRLRYDKLKWMNFSLLNRCALRIQACWRGYHGRVASQLRREAKRALDHEEHEAARRIQSIARGKLARGELARREATRAHVLATQHKRARCALQIQRIFRGKRARRVAARVKREHEEHARAALERLVRQTKARAAIKIQCCVRLFLARVKYRRRKEDARRKQLENERRVQREHAALVIQSALRRAKARRLLVLRRREFEKRISLMASEKAHDEIERLREEQEAELAKLRVQLLLQESKATEESAKLRKRLEEQREEEEERREQEAQELARLKLESLMQQHTQASDRKILEHQKLYDAEKLREQLEKQIQEKKDVEHLVRTQENEELAKLKMTALLQTTTISSIAEKARDEEAERLELEASQLQRAAQAMQREQAKLKVQSVCLKYIAKRRIQKLQAEQATALAQLHSEEERMRVKALQAKEMALAKLKAMMDDEARAREQELKALEAQMLERARLEKERIAKRNASARRIQACARGYLGRQRVKAIQRKIEKEREERAKAMEDQLTAAEAKMAEALNGTGGSDGGDTEDGVDGDAGTVSGSPEDWVEYWDENAQASYFFNIKTQEASWTRPFSAPASSKALEIAMAAVDYDADTYAGGYSASGATNANGYSAGGYADEYGFYDQYGQYHYYDEANAAAGANVNTYQAGNDAGAVQAAMQAGMMYPGYAAAAAAYAYQAAMAFGANPMVYGAAAMPYNPQMMMQNPMMMSMGVAASANAGMAPAPVVGSTGAMANDGSAVPPDPWEQFFDQYTGAAYYYNNITGEKYWAQ